MMNSTSVICTAIMYDKSKNILGKFLKIGFNDIKDLNRIYNKSDKYQWYFLDFTENKRYPLRLLETNFYCCSLQGDMGKFKLSRNAVSFIKENKNYVDQYDYDLIWCL